MLETARLRLRDFEEADWSRMHAVESDAEAVRYQSYAPRTADECRAYIARDAKARAAVPRRCFDLAVVRKADGLFIGRLGLDIKPPVADAPADQASLWFILDRACWGQGLMPEGAGALVDFGFREKKLHRVFLECDARNRGSIRLAEKLGMRREGHLREDGWYKGEWCDSVFFGVLMAEWAERNNGRA